MSGYDDYFLKESEFSSKQDDLALKQQFIYEMVQELIDWAISATHASYPQDTLNKIDDVDCPETWTGPSDDLIRSKSWEIIATIL